MPIDRGTNKTPKSVEFEEILLISIDEALFSLGESVRQSIYFHLEEQFHLKKKQIPKCLKKFQDSMEKIFGSGARFLEILIMKNLYLKIGGTVSMADDCSVDFLSYVNEAKNAYLKNEIL
jgi:hypothetical protein